jgi:hypothetical protein
MKWFILLLATFAAGCVTAQTTMLTPTRHPAVPPDEVRVFLSPAEVPAECERVVLIHAAGNVDLTNERQMIAAARKQAGRAGANAVAINTMRDPSTAARVAGEVFGLPSERKGQMLGYRCP